MRWGRDKVMHCLCEGTICKGYSTQIASPPVTAELQTERVLMGCPGPQSVSHLLVAADLVPVGVTEAAADRALAPDQVPIQSDGVQLTAASNLGQPAHMGLCDRCLNRAVIELVETQLKPCNAPPGRRDREKMTRATGLRACAVPAGRYVLLSHSSCNFAGSQSCPKSSPKHPLPST